MREKAAESLSKLRKLVPSKRHVPATRIDEATWTRIPNSGLRQGFGLYVDILRWLEEHADNQYARTVDAFWFESNKDAFLFQLKWAENSKNEP